MDSEDERELLREENEQESNPGFESLFELEFPQLQAYMPEEFGRVPQTTRVKYEGIMDSMPFRVIELCDIMKGFHEGSLDRCGRHPARYQSVVGYWLTFYAELKIALGYIQPAAYTVTELPTDPECCPDGHASTAEVLGAAPDGPQPAFSRKSTFWKMDPVMLFEISKSTIECIARNPHPVFQRTCLQHLPSELLCMVVEFTTPETARKLGATSKLFRDVSLRYMYADRSLLMKGDVMHAEDLSDLSPQDLRKLFHQRAALQRDVFVQEASYLHSRPDIACRVKHFTLTCWNGTQIRTAYPNSYKAQLEFQFTLARAVQVVIPLMANLQTLCIRNMAITSAFAQQLVLLPRLTTLTLSICKVTSKLRRVRTRSTSVRKLFLNLDDSDHNLNHSVWKLVPFFPNLSAVVVRGSTDKHTRIGEGSPMLLPFSNPPETLNPFLLPSMTHLQVSHLGYEEWDGLLELLQEASLHGTRPLHLTNLIIHAYDPLDRRFFFNLIDALRTAPLQHLVLDGIRYAGLALLDQMQSAFPELASLTLKYRVSPSCSRLAPLTKLWPHATWEYARALSRFPRLAHFGWNYDMDTLVYSHGLLVLENGRALHGDEWHEDEDFEEDLQPLTFAKICPGLQTFSTSSRSIYYIKREGSNVTIDDGWGPGLLATAVHDPPEFWWYHPWMK